jgi:hypothetical protein
VTMRGALVQRSWSLGEWLDYSVIDKHGRVWRR